MGDICRISKCTSTHITKDPVPVLYIKFTEPFENVRTYYCWGEWNYVNNQRCADRCYSNQGTTQYTVCIYLSSSFYFLLTPSASQQCNVHVHYDSLGCHNTWLNWRTGSRNVGTVVRRISRRIMCMLSTIAFFTVIRAKLAILSTKT